MCAAIVTSSFSRSQGGSHCLGRKSDNTAVMVPCSEGYEHVNFETPDIVPVATVRHEQTQISKMLLLRWQRQTASTYSGRILVLVISWRSRNESTIKTLVCVCFPSHSPLCRSFGRSNELDPVSFSLSVFNDCPVGGSPVAGGAPYLKGVEVEARFYGGH